MIHHADVVIDLQAGDTGKGKVANALASTGDYQAVLRFNGGGNAGHTIYREGKKIVTHQVPAGVLSGIPSIIGPGCVVDIEKLDEELGMLGSLGYTSPLFIDRRAHLITAAHRDADGRDTTIGTTKQGIGPAYRDKIDRKGQRFDEVNPVGTGRWTIGDVYEHFYAADGPATILCEGAQGFQLDIDWGDYPFVTSSVCTIAGVVQNGIAPRYIRKVIGVLKAYETYSGLKTHYVDFDSPALAKIQKVGDEVGATTGRIRQVRWLHLDEVIQAMYINNVTDLIINKVDVLEQVQAFAVVYEGKLYSFKRRREFAEFVSSTIQWNYHYPVSITWSTSQETI